jgi:2-oxoglutarate ferredoxin oxidoreductase subunit gamma
MNLRDLDRIEIRFGGTGGQGLVLASFIMAEAMMMSDYNIIQRESHGIEVRGGVSIGELIASKGEIYDLIIKEPNIFVTVSQESCVQYYKNIHPNALVIIDSSLVKNIPSDINSKNVFTLPFNQVIKEQLGTTLPINITFLGALSKLTDIVTPDSIKKAIVNRVTKESKEINLKAFHIGMDLAKKASS